MNVDPEDHIGRVISKSGRFYESDLLEDAYQKLAVSSNPGIVVDVGAHIGNHTLWFTRVCDREVVAIEPNAESIVALNSHLRLNRVWDQTEVYQVALGAEDGRGDYVPGPAGNTGMGRVEPAEEGPVAVVTLDSVLEVGLLADPSRRVALIKIDVEGSAVDVLRGAARTLELDRPLLYVEGELNEIHDFLGPHWRNFGKFGRTPTWGFRHADA
jgi:FkbM family methyltransferase